MKNADVPTFHGVAQLIAPNNTPPWLPQLLRAWGLEVAGDRELQEALPSKASLRKRLLEGQGAAERITGLLNDAPAMVFLEAESGIRVDNIVRFEIDLNTFARAAELAAASQAISQAGGKTKRGRGKAIARTTLSPKTFCALIVAETWLSVQGNYPAPRNREAAAAAQAYWLACGGAPSGRGSDTRTGWSHHFREAQSAATRSLRAEVQQHCAERARALKQ
jgi:hypothetical protein